MRAKQRKRNLCSQRLVSPPPLSATGFSEMLRAGRFGTCRGGRARYERAVG